MERPWVELATSRSQVRRKCSIEGQCAVVLLTDRRSASEDSFSWPSEFKVIQGHVDEISVTSNVITEVDNQSDSRVSTLRPTLSGQFTQQQTVNRCFRRCAIIIFPTFDLPNLIGCSSGNGHLPPGHSSPSKVTTRHILPYLLADIDRTFSSHAIEAWAWFCLFRLWRFINHLLTFFADHVTLDDLLLFTLFFYLLTYLSIQGTGQTSATRLHKSVYTKGGVLRLGKSEGEMPRGICPRGYFRGGGYVQEGKSYTSSNCVLFRRQELMQSACCLLDTVSRSVR